MTPYLDDGDVLAALREHLEAIIADKDEAYGVAHDMVKHAEAALAILPEPDA